MARKITKLGRSVGTQLFSRNNAGGVGPDGTQYYVELTVQSSQVSSDLTNFPVYVDLSNMPADFFANVQSDGGDIRVTESDGVTRCAVDLVSIDNSGSTGELHFLASNLSSSSNTTFHIYYGTTGTSNQPGAATTYGRNAVWSDYIAVYHMEDNPTGGTIADATGNGNTLTLEGTWASGDSVAGALGGSGLNFNGTDALASLNNEWFTNTTSWAMQVWVNTDDPGNRRAILTNGDGTSCTTNGIAIEDDGGLNKFGYVYGCQIREIPTATYTSGLWYHLVLKRSEGIGSIYQNGVKYLTNNNLPDTPSGNASYIGSYNSNGFFNGRLDEVRIKTSNSLADEWVETEYVNQNTPTTFYTVGSQTTV